MSILSSPLRLRPKQKFPYSFHSSLLVSRSQLFHSWNLTSSLHSLRHYLLKYAFISFSSLSYDRSKASSKASSPHSAIQSFLLQMRVSSISLTSSSSFLRLLPRLPVTSIPPFIFPLITRCRRQFRHKMWPIQFAFPLRISCRIFLCSLSDRQ